MKSETVIKTDFLSQPRMAPAGCRDVGGVDSGGVKRSSLLSLGWLNCWWAVLLCADTWVPGGTGEHAVPRSGTEEQSQIQRLEGRRGHVGLAAGMVKHMAALGQAGVWCLLCIQKRRNSAQDLGSLGFWMFFHLQLGLGKGMGEKLLLKGWWNSLADACFVYLSYSLAPCACSWYKRAKASELVYLFWLAGTRGSWRKQLGAEEMLS